AIHDFRSRERLRKKNYFREAFLEVAEAPFPKRERLCMRIIDAENPDAFVDPKFKYAFEFNPKRRPFFRFKIERENVVVFLGRILGKLNRAIGALSKPFGVIADIGMIRRTLKRDIQGDLNFVLTGAANQTTERLEPPEFRVNRFVASLCCADAPG